MGKWTEYEDGKPVREVEIPNPEIIDYGDVLAIRIVPDAQVVASEFPHPLVTIDKDGTGSIVGVSFVGPMRQAVLNVRPV